MPQSAFAAMVIENREPVKVFLRIRPEIEGNEDEREKSEVHVDASGVKEMMKMIVIV